MPPTLSIITVCYNSAATIAKTLESVAGQDYGAVEHIIVDGASRDNTLEVVRRFPHVSRVVSEPDEGIYDAINKGIKLATGEVVGILNSDDAYAAPDILSRVMAAFEEHRVDSVYGDIRFVSPRTGKVVRYYSSRKFHPRQFRYGYMPAHPSFFVKREVYEKYGLFKTGYKIGADYELLIRFLRVHQISYRYLDLMMVNMLTGGVSNQSLKSFYVLNKEIVRACRENGIRTNLLLVSLKYFRKVFELVRRGGGG